MLIYRPLTQSREEEVHMVKKTARLKFRGDQLTTPHNSKSTHYQGLPSNIFPPLHTYYL